jgi:PTH1 family peptidyl-tRNA hydrolase
MTTFKMPIKMVVGLGNPGEKYVRTRHNVGYRVIDELGRRSSVAIKLFKPSTFMNLCGPDIAEKARRNGIEPSEVLVICDDFSLPLKKMRIRRSGSSGGHNGLKSILETFHTPDVPRLRVGIGPVPMSEDPADFVLKSFDAEEFTTIGPMIGMAANAVEAIVTNGLEKAMNEFNSELDIA